MNNGFHTQLRAPFPIPSITSRFHLTPPSHAPATFAPEESPLNSATENTPKRTRAEIARANGAKSKGPVTPRGKAISSRNATKHGLTSKQIVLPDESAPSYLALHRSYVDHFSPRNVVERDLVTFLAVTRWRMRRLVSVETSYLAHELNCSSEGTGRSRQRPESHKSIARIFSRVDGRNGLPLIARYEGTLQRTYERAYNQLLALRAEPNKENAGAKQKY